MQKSNYGLRKIALVPIPWAALHEIDLDPRRDAMQICVRGDQIILERLDADESKVCLGDCPRCLGRHSCDALCE